MSSSGDFRDILSNMTSNRDGNRFTMISFIAALILLSYTGYDTVVYRAEVISSFADDNEYRITFSTQNETMQIVETLQDDETRNVIFDLSEINISDGFMIGYIDITITSEEESGISGQCDSVAGDIIENDLTAQWERFCCRESDKMPFRPRLQLCIPLPRLDRKDCRHRRCMGLIAPLSESGHWLASPWSPTFPWNYRSASTA